MSGAQKTTLVGLASLAAAVVVSDLWFLFDKEQGNTYSSVIQGQNWAAGLVGYVAVHVARKPTSKALGSSWFLVLAGAVLAGFGSEVLGGGLFGLLIGGGCAYVAWGNSSRT